MANRIFHRGPGRAAGAVRRRAGRTGPRLPEHDRQLLPQPHARGGHRGLEHLAATFLSSIR